MPEEFDTTYRGMDLVAIDRYRTSDEQLPELNEDEQRFAGWYLVEAGVSGVVAARRLGVSEKCVMNWHAKQEAKSRA